MTVNCAAPDAGLGVALRLATFADCQARAIGENGFQAMVGGPIIAGLLSGLVTIFVALIGYRLILGQSLSLKDGVGWTVRLGIVLTLTTAWPAFQTLVYGVAVNGPSELATIILPSSGLPSEGLDARVQQAYDTMRLGVTPAGTAPTEQTPPADAAESQAAPAAQPGTRPSPTGQLPQTASAFVMSTVGVSAALRIATGFLLAVAPLAVLTLLFDATLGIFSGWVRALAGTTLGLLAATIVTAIDLVMVEGELASQQAYSQGMISMITDPQALTTLVLLFAIVMLVMVVMAMRMGGAFTLRFGATSLPARSSIGSSPEFARPGWASSDQRTLPSGTSFADRPRAAAIADALSITARREQNMAMAVTEGRGSDAPARHRLVAQGLDQAQSRGQSPLAQSRTRNGSDRRSRRAVARDTLA